MSTDALLRVLHQIAAIIDAIVGIRDGVRDLLGVR